MIQTDSKYLIRNTRREDFPGIIRVCREVYPVSPPWSEEQLASHLTIFPKGQLVAVESGTGRVVGMAASLIVLWDDYDFTTNWRDFTGGGTFTNHDPVHGKTLYGAEVMVSPRTQGRGLGKKLYAERRDLAHQLNLLRIRAGGRLAGYQRYRNTHTPEEYVRQVVLGHLSDPTLSFQLKEGFRVLAVVGGYLRNDPESLGYAAVIEWLNPSVVKPIDAA